MSDLLARAVEIAFEAHKDQYDKQGMPYIFHVMRVAMAVEDPHRIAALLHDVVEDTSWTLDDLRKEFPTFVVDSLDALTHRKGQGETYAHYIGRVAKDETARIVKLADLRDNLSPDRISFLAPEAARSLAKRYMDAFRRLSDADNFKCGYSADAD